MSTSLVAPEQLEAEEPEIEESGEDWQQEDGFPNLPEEKQNVLKGLLRSALPVRARVECAEHRAAAAP